MSSIKTSTYDRIIQQIKNQLEYYYSWDNLIKDLHLRGKMDQNGWVPVSLISSFPIMRELVRIIRTDAEQTVVRVALTTQQLEVSADQKYLRPRVNPTYWPLSPQVQIPEPARLPPILCKPVPLPPANFPPGLSTPPKRR